jgi:hypothetical protein
VEVLTREDVGILYGHLAYFTTFWYSLWPFGMIYDYLDTFSRFGMLYKEKSGNPDKVPNQLEKSNPFCHNRYTTHFVFFEVYSLLKDGL